MDGGAWWAAVHGVAKSRTWLSDFTCTFHFHALEKEMATHSSVLAWRIPRTGEPGGLPSMGSHRVGHDWSDLAAAANCKIQKSISKLAMTVYRKQRKIGYFFKVQLFLSGHLMGLPLIFIWGAIHFSFFWKEEPTFPISPFWENSTPFPQIFFSF